MIAKKAIWILLIMAFVSSRLDAFHYFARTYGTSSTNETAIQFRLANDGSYLICGTSSYQSGAICIKVDSTGEIEWYKNFGSCGCSDVANTADGNFIMVSPCAGDTFRVVKFGQNGETEWDKRYILDGGYDRIKAIKELGGNFYVGFRIAFDSIGIVKLNSIGEVVWAKVYNIEGYTDEELGDIAVADDSIAIVAFSSTSEDQKRIALMKISQDGDVGWNRLFYREANSWLKVFDLLRASDGYYLAGWADTLAYLDAFLMKINNLREVAWAKTFTIADRNDSILAINPTSDGNFLVIGVQVDQDQNGYWYSYIFYMKFDGNGNTMWSRHFRKIDEDYTGVNIEETSTGQLAFAGNKSISGVGDYLLVTTQSDGTFPGGCQYFGDDNRTVSNLSLAWNDKPVSVLPLTVTEDTGSSCPFDVNILCESSTGLSDGGTCSRNPMEGAAIVHNALMLKKMKGVTYKVWRTDGRVVYQGKGTRLFLPDGLYLVNDGKNTRKVIVIK